MREQMPLPFESGPEAGFLSVKPDEDSKEKVTESAKKKHQPQFWRQKKKKKITLGPEDEEALEEARREFTDEERAKGVTRPNRELVEEVARIRTLHRKQQRIHPTPPFDEMLK